MAMPKNLDILRYIGVGKAESVIITNDDDIACMQITRFIHDNFPDAVVITKSESIINADRFKKFGATMVVSKNLETALQLSHAALNCVGKNTNEIDSALNAFRDASSEALKEVINYNETSKD